MDNKNIDFSDITLREIGLECDANNHIIDQDTGCELEIKGKKLRYNGDSFQRLNKDECYFDPLNNTRLMLNLFSYYSEKLKNEGYDSVDNFSTLQSINSQKAITEAKVGNDKIQSELMYNESCRLLDVICKINDSDQDITKFDGLKEDNKKPKIKKAKN